ncbi:hypothetical protein [Dysgonomonas sp. 25]|uniref:hypothetical protein n=1 Tax=Dysgonomonas sp. 25 TaxID=2302933 RepID=UPI001C877CC9|nr:hypothetical protein [Dysgonomonas sp. 25]
MLNIYRNWLYISLAIVEDNRLWQNIKPSGTQDEVVRVAFNQDVKDMKTWLTSRLNWLDQASFQD